MTVAALKWRYLFSALSELQPNEQGLITALG